jgi:hypothetical protein
MPNQKAPTAAQRITALESHIALITGGAAAATKGDTRPLTFSLQPGGATKVELTLDFTENLILGSGPVQSKPRPNHTPVFLNITIYGNPGQRATIDVSNATPSPFVTAPIPKGADRVADTRSIMTKW